MEEEILLNIEFNNSDVREAISNITESRKAIDDLVAANKKLVEQGLKNSTAYTKNSESIKALNSEVSANSKIVQANTQAVKANENSIDQLKEANKLLLVERNKVDTSTEAGRKKIVELNAEYDKNSKIIADNSTKVEKQRFNIGNYASALEGIVPGLGQFSTDVAGAANASGGLTSGIFSMVKASLAFIATPLGAVIAALVAGFKLLQTFVTGSVAGMDLFEDASAAVSTILDIVVDRVVAFVGAIGKIITGDFAGGLEGIEKSFSGIGDEMEREIALTLELTAAARNLEDAEINYDITASKTANTIKELLLQAKNRTLTEKQRIDLLTQASKLEQDLNADLVKNRQEALRITNEEANKRVQIARIAGETEEAFGQRLIDSNLLLDEQRDKVKDSIIAFNGALGESIAVQEKIQNQVDALAEKAEEDRQKRQEKAEADRIKAAEAEKKRLEDIEKKKEELAKKELTAANALAIAKLDAEAKQIEGAELRADKLIEIEQTKQEQIKENANLTATEKELALFESEERINAILETSRQEQIKEVQDALAAELEAYSLYVDGLINEKKRQLLEGTISQAEYNKEIEDLNTAALETDLAIKQQFGVEDVALSGQITDAKIKQKENEAAIHDRLEKQKVQAVQSTLGQVAGLFNKNSIAFKALASAQTLIQTYQSAQAVFTGMTSTIPGPVGIALGIAGAAAAVISGLANVAKINSTQVPKLEEGGLIEVGGRRHSQGGEDMTIGGKLVANVEQGETVAVLKRGSSGLLRNLSAVNTMVGGRDFYNDRSTRFHNADGGLIARSAISSSSQFATQSVESVLKGIKIFTRVTDLERVQGQMTTAKFTSELS